MPTELIFRCPDCGHQFKEFDELGVCPKCDREDGALFTWINPKYREKRRK